MVEPANFFEHFERVLIINLPSRRDRRREIEAELKRVGVALTDPRFEFVNGIRPAAADGFPTIGAHGCFQSHLSALRRAKNAGFASILILEDDVDFVPDFDDRSRAISAALTQANWDFFYGGYTLTPDERTRLGPVNQHLAVVQPALAVQAAHFIAISKQQICELIAYLEAMLQRPPGDAAGGPMHVDEAYSWYRRSHPNAITLAALAELGIQRSSRSDIHRLRFYDRFPVVRDVAQKLRRLRRSFA